MPSPAPAVQVRRIRRRGVWSIDSARSDLRVAVKVGLFGTARGRFGDVTGHLELGDDPAGSRVTVTVGTNSLTSGSATMDALLSGAVDAQAHPVLTFASKAVRPDGDGWIVHGLLATESGVLDVALNLDEPAFVRGGVATFSVYGELATGDALRLLSRRGLDKILGKTMRLDLTVVATRD